MTVKHAQRIWQVREGSLGVESVIDRALDRTQV